jgi:serine/threonine protein kinase
VHRDVKLENILRRADGTVVLADWGFASPWRAGTTITGSVGSPHYSAPEIVRNEAYTGPDVDVWSLGVVLYGTFY